MADGEKLDLYKLHKADYAAGKKPALVQLSPAQYLTFDGQGAPEGECFQQAMQAMYANAFNMKMTCKFAGGRDYAVCKLEGLWWADGDGWDFPTTPREQWRWKVLIRTPDFIGQAELDAAQKALIEKGKDPSVTRVKLETLDEGLCVQMLHVGPYSGERTAIEAMHAFAAEKHLVFSGRHHEIYLSDPRRVAPEKLRTILRYPVRPA